MDKIGAYRRWKEYEDLARERPKPQPTSSFHRPEPAFLEQLWEWIGRHWLLYSLLAVTLIAGGCMILDSMRGMK